MTPDQLPLGNDRPGNPSTAGESYDRATIERLRQRLDAGWLIRDLNAYLFPNDRLGQCGAPRTSEVAAQRRPDGRIQFSGIATCGSVTGCLRCASIIRATRASEVDYWAKAHLDAGLGLAFVTFTLPHVASDELEALVQAMKGTPRDGTRKAPGAWDKMISGSGWLTLKQRFGVLGQIRSDEVTHGDNGWHPHIHVLFFFDRPDLTEDELDEFRARIGKRWGDNIQRTLGREIHGIYGVDARPVRDINGVGDYVSKIHFEMVRGDLKIRRQDETKGGSRTPWQVGIDGVRTGDAHDIARWREYTAAMKGQKVLGVSKAIRDRYGAAPTTEQTDEELAAQAQDADDVAALSNEVYGNARRRRVDGQSVIARAIVALEDDGLEAMATKLEVDLGQRVVVEERTARLPLVRFLSSKAERLLEATEPIEVEVADRNGTWRGLTERLLW